MVRAAPRGSGAIINCAFVFVDAAPAVDFPHGISISDRSRTPRRAALC